MSHITQKPISTMLELPLFPLLLLILLISLALTLKRRQKSPELPPSPPGLPIIGHLHIQKEPFHRTYHAIAQKLGPVFSLRQGNRLGVVVSSYAVAEECFTKNDVVLANRPRLTFGKYLNYNHTVLSWLPHGDHWRNLRRLYALHLFSNNRLNRWLPIRKEETVILLKKLHRASNGDFVKVEMKSAFSRLVLDVIMKILSGKRYYGEDEKGGKEAEEYREIVKGFFYLGATPYYGDYIPILKWFSRGYERKLQGIASRLDLLLQSLVDEQRKNKGNPEFENTVIGDLLALQETQPEYTDVVIKGIIWNFLRAGSDTTTVTLEWALTSLLSSPHILEKVRAEIDAKVGQDRLIDESDVEALPYFRGIISETLRLFPAAPMNVPHYSTGDCTVGGYHVPANTTLWTNIWTIHRDPNVWEEPESFKPERYEDGGIEANKRLLTFGWGRRACPGAGMSHRLMNIALGALLQCFEWEKVGDEEIDMAEGGGISMPKKEPLVAMCKSRPIMEKLISSGGSI